ncbi:MAG: zinc ribbon domain-containing protein [Planctomycetota bacterium]
MSDNIVFPCPACGTKYNVGPQHAGKNTKCKKCGASITVPTPQADNQTVIGVTRTIRRADIAPGASSRETATAAPPPVVSAPETEVDMGGGSSVLRKDATVHGVPKPVTAGPRGGTRPPVGAGRSTRATGGRPMPHGQGQPHGKKKGGNGLVIGIVSGVVALVLVVVLVVALGGDNGGTGGGTDGGGDGSGPAELSEADKIAAQIKDWRKVLDSEQLDVEGLTTYYENCKKEYAANSNEEFKKLRDDFARAAIKKSSVEMAPLEEAKFILKMSKAGYSSAEGREEDCLRRVLKAKKAKRDVKKDGRIHSEAHPVFKELALKLGWGKYDTPKEFDNEFNEWHLESMKSYRDVLFGSEEGGDITPSMYENTGLLPPARIETLKDAEKPVWEEANALRAQDKKDGYAITARQAYFRFLNANRNSKKFNVKEGKKSFCPEAVGRGPVRNEETNKIVDRGESIEDIWTYTYAKPFLVLVEKPADGEVSEELLEQLRQKALILRDVEKWFRANIIDPFGLKRVKPLGPDFTVRDKEGNIIGTETKPEKAEREGWPMELIIFKDGPSFTYWLQQYTANAPPGVRAMYSPPASTVVTWDKRDTGNDRDEADNLETLVHEVFHQLSDHHATNPINYEEGEAEERLRYSTVLVQEGLTESIAAFKRTGESANATYEFAAPNVGRIGNFFSIHDMYVGDMLFTKIEDLVTVMHYGMIDPVFRNRAVAMKDDLKNKNFAFAFNGSGFGMSLYYAAACMAGYFFYHYEDGGEYPLRDKWWEYVEKDYNGDLADVKKITGGRVNPDKVVEAFEEVFELESEDDWQELNDLFWEYIQVLRDEVKDEDAMGDDDEATNGHDEYAMAASGARTFAWLRDDE